MATPTSFPYTIIDAFSSSPFSGNPAAVIFIEDELKEIFTEDNLRKIAAEFNLSETAFISPTSTRGTYNLRWLTPTEEVNLCGHATLASGFALSLRPELSDIETFKFNTLSGELTTRKLPDGSLELNFPAIMPQEITGSEYAEYEEAIKRSIVGSSPKIKGIFAEEKYLVVEFDESASEQLGDWQVNVEHLRIQKHPLVGFTAQTKTGSRPHIVTRVFGPLLGVNEDPVTGSYHCALAPFWSTRLSGFKSGDEIVGVQGGPRKGEIRCVWLEAEQRVLLRGSAFEVATGTMRVA
ncbi:hypothetical protein NliqN6_2696 [Naganishia liquefaciens]|uniref:PhzF family phenazine biosynthesis protein n=1 Tax=Naganishia liquefaciens TaxID=104408 RepID=A0A8H3TSN0_9TREE|nr:hypothetical protein NliqN6_2696 [Naganishia liquefaciens]